MNKRGKARNTIRANSGQIKMKLSFILILTISTFFNSLQGQWEVINEGYDFRIIDFVSKDVGWMVTDDTILKTTDGGETWFEDSWDFNSGNFSSKRIEVLDFIDDSIGWISMYTKPIDGSGTYGLFKTIDGGKTWKKKLEEKYLELEYVSEDMVIVSWQDAYTHLLKSTSGGSSWMDVTPANHNLWGVSSMSFINSNIGIYTCEDSDAEFNITFNGGKTWNYRESTQFRQIDEIGFIDNLNGYFIADRTLCKTEDAFETWTIVYENQSPIYSCHFFNNDFCIALMDDSIGCNILKSYDGGHTWIDSVSFRLPGRGFGCKPGYKITFNNDSDGFIYDNSDHYSNSDPRILLKSIDHGDTWSMLNLSYPFQDVSFVNAQKGFVVGGCPGAACNFGDILGTSDGGDSWEFLFGRRCAFTNCDFVNDSTGFASFERCGIKTAEELGFSTNLLETNNGGNIWNEFSHGFNLFTQLNFIDEHTGFAGNDSGIFMSSNGGETWGPLLSSETIGTMIESMWYIKDFISNIVRSDERSFWSIAYNNIVRFNPEGSWERIELETEQDLYKIFFKDENTGWITSGGYWYDPDPPAMVKTEDGGKTWFRSDYPYQFRDFCFKDVEYGWAVGLDSLNHGVILETTNGGDDWTVQVDSLSAPLNGIDYRDGILWAVGEHGLVLKMYDSTYVSVIKHPDAEFSEDYLLHIYPNPTSSILNLETEFSGPYIINIFNLNGQLMLKRVLTGNNHQLDLSSFREGAYFITIRSKDSVTTKKVIKIF